jgi:hypothetical protein
VAARDTQGCEERARESGLQPVEAEAAASSDRGRAPHFAPMRDPLLERALASVGQLLEVYLFQDLEGETLGAVNVPGGLKRLVRLDALPQRERAAGPDRGKIGRCADPLSVGCLAPDRIHAGDGLALLVGRDGGLAFASVHRCYLIRFLGA